MRKERKIYISVDAEAISLTIELRAISLNERYPELYLKHFKMHSISPFIYLQFNIRLLIVQQRRTASRWRYLSIALYLIKKFGSPYNCSAVLRYIVRRCATSTLFIIVASSARRFSFGNRVTVIVASATNGAERRSLAGLG